MTIKAIYEDGVFKPVEKIVLPEHTEVDVTLPANGSSGEDPVVRQSQLWNLLSQRFDGGDPQVAQKHNEHQP